MTWGHESNADLRYNEEIALHNLASCYPLPQAERERIEAEHYDKVVLAPIRRDNNRASFYQRYLETQTLPTPNCHESECMEADTTCAVCGMSAYGVAARRVVYWTTDPQLGTRFQWLYFIHHSSCGTYLDTIFEHYNLQTKKAWANLKNLKGYDTGWTEDEEWQKKHLKRCMENEKQHAETKYRRYDFLLPRPK